jgi:hypothetical protein
MTVSDRFEKFLGNITLTDVQLADGKTKHEGIITCLNKHYYGSTSATSNARLVGSWGKYTRIRPPRDIDVLFALPYSVYQRFEQRPGNKQSQLLQEVKGVLGSTYPRTDISGDRHVVLVPFESFSVEVVPAFLLKSEQFWVCDTDSGGRYKTFDPTAELNHLVNSDKATAGNTRHLVRMMKCWQAVCNVPLKSFWIELLVVEFLSKWANSGKTTVYYDWMVRDFLGYLSLQAPWASVIVPGTNELIPLGDKWKSKAESAHGRAKTAVEYEANGLPYDAGVEWQKIFGTYIPIG